MSIVINKVLCPACRKVSYEILGDDMDSCPRCGGVPMEEDGVHGKVDVKVNAITGALWIYSELSETTIATGKAAGNP